MELYNETLSDLLCPSSGNLKIHESISVSSTESLLNVCQRGIFVGNLSSEPVRTFEEACDIIKLGLSNRHVGETLMNDRSSRSHTVLQLVRFFR